LKFSKLFSKRKKLLQTILGGVEGISIQKTPLLISKRRTTIRFEKRGSLNALISCEIKTQGPHACYPKNKISAEG